MIIFVVQNMVLLAVMLAILFLGKTVLDVFIHLRCRKMPGCQGINADYELTVADNPAFGVSFVSFLGGITIGTLSGLPQDTTGEFSYHTYVALMMVHGAFSITALMICWWVNDKFILYKIKNLVGIFQKNISVGIVEGGSFIATAIILAGAWTSGGFGSVILWFFIGQFLLIIAGLVYQRITPYDVHPRIKDDNRSCAFGLAGFLIGVSWVVQGAVGGPAVTFLKDIGDTVIYFLVGFAVMLLMKKFTQLVFMRRTSLEKEQEQQNLNSGLLEAAVYIIAGSAFNVLL